MTFGNRLKTAREKRGYSAEDASNISGIPVSSLSAYEADQTAPDPETVNELVKLYEVSPYFICGLTDVYSPLIWGDNLLDISALSDENKRLMKELLLALFKAG